MINYYINPSNYLEEIIKYPQWCDSFKGGNLSLLDILLGHLLSRLDREFNRTSSFLHKCQKHVNRFSDCDCSTKVRGMNQTVSPCLLTCHHSLDTINIIRKLYIINTCNIYVLLGNLGGFGLPLRLLGFVIFWKLLCTVLLREIGHLQVKLQ